jgi:hypothetical protein
MNRRSRKFRNSLLRNCDPYSPISWTHYVLLLSIKDPDERSFYETEAH